MRTLIFVVTLKPRVQAKPMQPFVVIAENAAEAERLASESAAEHYDANVDNYEAVAQTANIVGDPAEWAERFG